MMGVSTLEVAVICGLAVLFFIWGAYNLLGYRKEKREITKNYETMFKSREGRDSFISTLGIRFDRTPFAKKYRNKLLQAGIHLLPSEFFAIILLGLFAITFIMKNFFKLSLPLSVGISILVCILAYWLLFLLRRNKYVDKFNNQISEVCRLLGNSTRAGLTISQGIEVVAAEVGSPAREEFKELAYNLRLGVNFESALKEVEKKVPTREVKLFVAALLIQKKAGGNLTKVLEEMAKTLEERKILRQTVKTATAEQRFVSYILPIMPVVMILMLNTTMDNFLQPILTVPGLILSSVFIIGMVIAFILVKAITNIKV